MQNISILPIEYKKKQRAYEMVSVYILSAILAVVLFAVVFLYFHMGNKSLEAELDSIIVENSSYRSRIAALEPYKVAQNKIKATRELIVKAAGTNPNWREIIDEICSDMPQNIWLSDISCSYASGAGKSEDSKKTEKTETQGKTGELKMKGSALDHSSVANWLDRIKSVEGLKDVNCKFTAGDETGAVQSLSFEITAVVLPGESWNFDLVGGQIP